MGVLVLASLIFLVRKIMLGSELKALEEYNQRESVLEACEEYDAAQERMSAISAIHTGMESLGDEISEYPLVDSSVEAVITSCAEGLVSAEISSYDSTTGILSFNTSAGNVEQINGSLNFSWRRRYLRLWITRDIHRTRTETGV